MKNIIKILEKVFWEWYPYLIILIAGSIAVGFNVKSILIIILLQVFYVTYTKQRLLYYLEILHISEIRILEIYKRAAKERKIQIQDEHSFSDLFDYYKNSNLSNIDKDDSERLFFDSFHCLASLLKDFKKYSSKKNTQCFKNTNELNADIRKFNQNTFRIEEIYSEIKKLYRKYKR